MKGKMTYFNEGNQINIFGRGFSLRYPKLKYRFKDKDYFILPNFISTYGIKEKKIEIKIDWKMEELLLHSSSNLSDDYSDLSNLFEDCKTLESLSLDFRVSRVVRLYRMFGNCISLRKLPDSISNLNVQNVLDMSEMFNDCQSLTSIPDISNWNTNSLTNLSGIFYCCCSLLKLPDISKWNTNHVINMFAIFKDCLLLKSLPDISKWNTSSVVDFDEIFSGCRALISLPNLSKWKTFNGKTMNDIFLFQFDLFT